MWRWWTRIRCNAGDPPSSAATRKLPQPWGRRGPWQLPSYGQSPTPDAPPDARPDSGLGIETHQGGTHAYAADRGWTVIDQTAEKAVSGSQRGRPPTRSLLTKPSTPDGLPTTTAMTRVHKPSVQLTGELQFRPSFSSVRATNSSAS